MKKLTAEEFVEMFPDAPIMSENCEDKACSACGNREEFRIRFSGLCTLTDEGTDDDGDHEWEPDSWCECKGCYEEGTVADFTILGLDELLDDRQDCDHKWEETKSFGATVGYEAKCKRCGLVETFTPSDRI